MRFLFTDENEKAEAIRRQLGNRAPSKTHVSSIMGERTERSYSDASQKEASRRSIAGMAL